MIKVILDPASQADIDAEYTHWILKFDGVNDLELGQAKSYGRIEYAYYLMAKDSGIEMSDNHLIDL